MTVVLYAPVDYREGTWQVRLPHTLARTSAVSDDRISCRTADRCPWRPSRSAPGRRNCSRSACGRAAGGASVRDGAAPSVAVRMLREVPEGRARDRDRAPPGDRYPADKSGNTEHQLLTRVRVRDEGAGPGRGERLCRATPWHGQFLSRDRSYLSTPLSSAARHGISALDALTSAFQGRPWIPETG
jgi:hypothetical protein